MFWLNTFTGKRFDLGSPKVDDIDIVDIAVALSHQARYAGHTRRHYSVAEHSVIVHDAIDILCPLDPAAKRWALMHDAAEAYVTDVPWPIKAAGLVPQLSRLEKHIMELICERFGLEPTEPEIVKEVDLELLDLEADTLLIRHPDWPRGTPRVPRVETRQAWVTRPRMYAAAGPAEVFLARARARGMSTARDLDRLRELRAR